MTDPSPEIPPFPASAPQPKENRLLFGRFGLRAGYGIVIYLAVATFLTIVGGLFALGWTHQFHAMMKAREFASTHPGFSVASVLHFVPLYVIVADGFAFLGLLVFCWFMSHAEHRGLGAYGLGRERVRDVIPGAIWGIVSMSALVFFLKARGYIVFDGLNLHGAAIAGYGIAWLIAFVLVGFYEEYVFRGYLLYTLTRGFWGIAEKFSPRNPQPVAYWIAATLMSLTFAALHIKNGGENAFGIFEVFFIGMAFCYAVWRTGSLWWGIGYHALWDFMQSFTFGVADSGNISVGRLFVTHPHGAALLSGGTDGPEGSLFSFVAAVLTFVAVRVTARRGQYPLPNQLPYPQAEPPSEPSSGIA